MYPIMTEFVLDIETYPQSDDHCVHGCRSYTKYFFQIDVNGNVNISEKQSCKNDGSGEKKNILSINDNIPVPNYFINIIKALILQNTFQQIDSINRNNNIHGCGEYYGSAEHNIIKVSAIKSDRGFDHVYKKYWVMVIDTIKRIKQEVKEIVENPQDNLDIKAQLDTYITKTKQQQKNIIDLEKKIENIQTAYFDTLNDNKKLKEIIKTKDNKQTEVEIENNRLLQEVNNKKQLDEYNKKEQQKMEELEKERLWIEYKLQKQNYNPLYR
jgi:hypothetical protein